MIWKESNQPSEGFDYVVGGLVGIDVRRCSTSKGELVYCDFQMMNDDDRFVISTLVSSGITANLVSRLKCVKDPVNSMLRIDAWANNIYTNLKENGIPVTRVILPRVEKIEHGLKVESPHPRSGGAGVERSGTESPRHPTPLTTKKRSHQN